MEEPLCQMLDKVCGGKGGFGFSAANEASGYLVEMRILDPTEVVRTALAATGAERARTVPYGTDAHAFKQRVQLVVMGPGDIAQAHTDGEWIELAQLRRAVDVYRRMVQAVCEA